jgi:hypothetical protein
MGPRPDATEMARLRFQILYEQTITSVLRDGYTELIPKWTSCLLQGIYTSVSTSYGFILLSVSLIVTQHVSVR